MESDVPRLVLRYLVGEKTSFIVRSAYLEPRSICKHGTYRAFEQYLVNAFFILFCLYRLTDTLEVYNLFEFLFEHRRCWKVEQDHKEREHTVCDHKEEKAQVEEMRFECEELCFGKFCWW